MDQAVSYYKVLSRDFSAGSQNTEISSFKFTSLPGKDVGSVSTHKNSVRRVLLEIVTQTLLSTLIYVTLNRSSHALP